jgi:carboxymethylenebutenolidase
MKTPFLSFMTAALLTLGTTAYTAQAQEMTCHPTATASTDATVQFAMLSKDEAFRSAHPNPLPYTHVSKVGKMVTYKTPDGKTASAFELKAPIKSDKYLFVYQEWWGLNDHIKKESEKYYNELGDVNVIALDMYDGKIATNPEDAGKYMQAADEKRLEAIMKGALAYVGPKAKIASIGWCFGGGLSLKSALMEGKQAVGCVMYYGMPVQDVAKLKTLNTDVLGIFAGKEKWINPQVVAEFEQHMKEAGKKVTIKSFEAEHGFANPSNPIYDKEATAEAYALSTNYLKERLK